MARYTHSLTSAITNKLGGVVFTTSGAHRTLRARAVPAGAATAAQRPQVQATHNAVAFYRSLSGPQLSAFNLAASFWAFQSGPYAGRRNNPLAYIAACFRNAAVLGTTPTLAGSGYDADCPPIIAIGTNHVLGNYILSFVGPGYLSYLNPFLIYASVVPASTEAAPGVGKGTLLGGCNGVPTFTLNAPMISAFGQAPASGMSLYVRAKPLIPGYYFWAQSVSGGTVTRLPQFSALVTLP